MVEVVINKLDSAEAFLRRWSALYASAENVSFYQSPAWMEAWLAMAASVCDLYVAEAHEGGALAMAGVFGLGARRPPLLGLREIRLQETGDPAIDAIYVEYNDFLAAKGADPALRARLVVAVLDAFADADSIVIRNVRAGLAQAVREVAGGWHVKVLREQPTYVVDLETIRRNGGDVFDAFSASLRTKINRAVKGYETCGVLSVRVDSTPEAHKMAWRRMVELHEARWQGKGAFANDAFIAFHQKLQALAPDACQLLEVLCGEETIGVLYNFIHDGRVLNYQSGFRLEADNKLTPGFVSHALACRHYLNAGMKTYDLLAGEADYKTRLGEQAETLTSLALERPSWRIRARNFIKGLGGS